MIWGWDPLCSRPTRLVPFLFFSINLNIAVEQCKYSGVFSVSNSIWRTNNRIIRVLFFQYQAQYCWINNYSVFFYFQYQIQYCWRTTQLKVNNLVTLLPAIRIEFRSNILLLGIFCSAVSFVIICIFVYCCCRADNFQSSYDCSWSYDSTATQSVLQVNN